MFGHQSFSELPLSTVLFRIFVTPTGVSITATVDSSAVGVSGSAGIVVEKDFVETGTSTFRNASGSSVTEKDIRDLAAAQVVESTRINILEKLEKNFLILSILQVQISLMNLLFRLLPVHRQLERNLVFLLN